jgi:undecaprenyl-phosphate galactose phosphotransferase
MGDKESIFFKQIRIGKDGKPFMMYKFRSMVYNAEDLLKELLKDEQHRNDWVKNQKIEKDPRITPIGIFLRKSSIDELPQILNVLKGDMSIVGPRPLVEGELEDHGGSKLYW